MTKYDKKMLGTSDESFIPANQRTSVLYCRLSDFWSHIVGRLEKVQQYADLI
jgi:hypothetical protein